MEKNKSQLLKNNELSNGVDNKKIPTHLGTIVIIIIAVTVGVFVWRSEKAQEQAKMEDQNNVNQTRKAEKNSGQSEKLDDQILDNTRQANEEKPINTSDWKICKNETFNYEFKYPSEWLIVDKYLTALDNCDSKTVVFSVGNDRYSTKNKNFTIEVLSQDDLQGTIYSGSVSLDEYYKKNSKLLSSRTKINETAIQGERADWFREQESAKISVWFFHNGTFYKIRTNIQAMNLVETMMNTFKFPSN